MTPITQVSVENFRCFKAKQTARLAPLTLLVGENSTGKTSFLAFLRATWEAVFCHLRPSFTEPPYDLGSFDEVVHRRDPQYSPHTSIGASLRGEDQFEARVTLDKRGPGLAVTRLRYKNEGAWIEFNLDHRGIRKIRAGREDWSWVSADVEGTAAASPPIYDEVRFLPLEQATYSFIGGSSNGRPIATAENGSPKLDWYIAQPILSLVPGTSASERPFAGAPIRARPQRTYNTGDLGTDPQGYHVPMLLAGLMAQHKEAWDSLRSDLQRFGRNAGLFDEISIDFLGKGAGGPFEIRVREPGAEATALDRNIIDVGYGVSQVLPIATELLRPGPAKLFLLQQPEVHLHPSAQAALGTLLCETASFQKQIVVETHSDYLIDRVRMDLRDGATRLKPEDVSILFFDRVDNSVRIHSLAFDQLDNLVSARHGGHVPDHYRRFFVGERERFLQL